MSSNSGQATTLLAFADPQGGGWGVKLLAADQPEPNVGPPEPAARNPEADETGRLDLCRLGADSTGGAALCALPSGRYGSLRLLAAWFPDRSAIALAALRPRGAKGHDRDAVSAAVVGERDGIQAFDPRLSSVYEDSGALRRAGIEMWLGETEEGDQYPRRLAGEVTGAPAQQDADGIDVIAYPLRCHARGEHGLGVYVLVQPR